MKISMHHFIPKKKKNYINSKLVISIVFVRLNFGYQTIKDHGKQLKVNFFFMT